MLVAKPEQALGDFSSPNDIAPEVFIDSVEINKISTNLNKLTLRYSLNASYNDETNTSKWINNEYILNNFFITLTCNDSIKQESLNSFKKRNPIKNNKIYGYSEFLVSAATIKIEAFCGLYDGDRLIFTGPAVAETIMRNDKITGSYYFDTVNVSKFGTKNPLKYVNKIKDLRIISEENVNLEKYSILSSEHTSSLQIKLMLQEQYGQNNDVFISHTTNKIAKLGYIFNLEKFLSEKSHAFRILSRHEPTKERILSASYLDVDNSFFYKKNITLNNQNYEIINSNLIAYRMSDKATDGRYIITSTDIPKNNEKSEYQIKIKLKIFDYSNFLYKNIFVDSIKECIDFLYFYKEKFEFHSRDESIDDLNTFIFENYYSTTVYENNKSFIEASRECIDKLSLLYNFITDKDIKNYHTLFASCFHPLTTNIFILNYILKKLESLGRSFYSFFEKNIFADELNNKIQKSPFFYFEKEFKISTLDYNYDEYHGYEVISPDNFENRISNVTNGLLKISQEEKNVRKMYEADKYFGTTDENIYTKIQDFSISSIDFGFEKNYYLINNPNEPINTYNDILLNLNNYNNNNKYNNNLNQVFYFAAADKGILIKSLASRPNISYNNYMKSTVYDQNIDSFEDSQNIIQQTDVRTLYYILDENYFLPIPEEIIQEKASKSEIGVSGSRFPLTEEVMSDLFLDAKKIIHYNCFHKDELIEEGENYSVYRLKDSLVNQVFNKKLKLFNEYYILEKQPNRTISINLPLIDDSYLQEALVNIPSEYMSREYSTGSLIISTSELL